MSFRLCHAGEHAGIPRKADFIVGGDVMARSFWKKAELSTKSQANTIAIIAPGWAMVLYLAEHLVRSGFNVVIYQDPAEPFPKPLPKWVSSVVAERFDSPAFAEQLREMNRNKDIHWILPIAEEAISICREVLSRSRKIYPRLTKQQYDLLRDKHRMADFARSIGLRVPEFTRVDTPEAALAVADEMGYPVVVKGNGGRGGLQVAISHNAQEVADGFERLAHTHPIIERYVNGNTWAAGGFFVDGEPLRMHIYECVECLPAKTGPAVEIRHGAPPALEHDFRLLFRSLHWNGFASSDFIAGPDGTFYFIEMNPRLWGGVTSALAAGNQVLDPLAPALRGLTAEGLLDNKNGAWSFAYPRHLSQLTVTPYKLAAIRGIFSLKTWRGIPDMRYWKSNLYYGTDACYQFLRYAGSPILDWLGRRHFQK